MAIPGQSHKNCQLWTATVGSTTIQGVTQQISSLYALSHGGNGSNRGGRDAANIDLRRDLSNSGGALLGAIARDVSSLAALVACLASSVEGTAVGSGAVSGNVTELAAGVALHSLSLAITGKVVGATALVASGRARATGETTSAVATGEAATAHRSTTTHRTRANRVGASALSYSQLCFKINNRLVHTAR